MPSSQTKNIKITLIEGENLGASTYLVEIGRRQYYFSKELKVLLDGFLKSTDPIFLKSHLKENLGSHYTEQQIITLLTRFPASLFDETEADKLNTPIRGKVTIFKSNLVQSVADKLRIVYSPLFFKGSLILSIILIVVGATIVLPRLQVINLDIFSSVMVILGCLFSIFIHELGHASALAYRGQKSGHIGIGIYWVFPVFYAEVNNAWRLPSKKRILVDIGGIYFQLICSGLMTLALLFIKHVETVNIIYLIYMFNLYILFYTICYHS